MAKLTPTRRYCACGANWAAISIREHAAIFRCMRCWIVAVWQTRN